VSPPASQHLITACFRLLVQCASSRQQCSLGRGAPQQALSPIPWLTPRPVNSFTAASETCTGCTLCGQSVGLRQECVLPVAPPAVSSRRKEHP
jgi:hypothetical protein